MFTKAEQGLLIQILDSITTDDSEEYYIGNRNRPQWARHCYLSDAGIRDDRLILVKLEYKGLT